MEMLSAAAAAALLATAPELAAHADTTALNDLQQPGQSNDIFKGIIDFNCGIILGLDDVMEEKLGLKNSFGWAIIAYTILIKALTYPLNQSSIKNGAMLQLVQPRLQAIQKKYAGDQDMINRMMLRLYDDTGVSPLGGCIPGLVQVPIFIGLYRSVTQLANTSETCQKPFLWIPHLAGPVAPNEANLDWLLKSQDPNSFVPMVGWNDAIAYCGLPIILIGTQFYVQSMQASASQQGPAAALLYAFPVMMGYFTSISPQALGLYWLVNNVFSAGQTFYIKNNLIKEFPEYAKILRGEKLDDPDEMEEEENARPEPEVKSRGFAIPESAASRQEDAGRGDKPKSAWAPKSKRRGGKRMRQSA